MRLVPDRIDPAWISTLADEDLIDIESRLHSKFVLLERRQKRARGQKYDLFLGPADLMDAWDRWSRVNTATITRSLIPRRREAQTKTDGPG
jgi:hypothetical protein